MTGKYAYFHAKRQIVEAIDHRTTVLEAEKEKAKRTPEVVWAKEQTIRELENLRNFVRNHMLWSESKDS